MTNLLWTFQNRLLHLQPSLLLTLAAVTVTAGLFVWLGGFGFKKIMYTIAGAFFGAFCSLLTSGSNLPLAAALVGIFAVLAYKMQDSLFVMIASGAAAVIAYSILVRPYFKASDNVMAVIRQIAVSVPYYNWPILLAITALPFAVISWRGASAILSSAAGAIVMLAGAVMFVLTSSEFSIIGHMKSQPEQYYLILTLAMLLGTVVQMWVLPRISKGVAERQAKARVKKAKTKKNDTAKAVKSTTWRTA